MLGDFNDDSKQLLRDKIEVLGMTLDFPPKTKGPKTCCYDSNYAFVGDYILDSGWKKGTYFGIPKGYTRPPYRSDHDPVVLETVF